MKKMLKRLCTGFLALARPSHKGDGYKEDDVMYTLRAIADPWYTGNFDATYADVTEGCEALLELLTSGTVLSKS
ncbi:MAG: hypothetical protein KHY96_10155 [Lachnospiraceae bacterium]|nr:hypothetical protein [Lachnospiraceae bacterium]